RYMEQARVEWITSLGYQVAPGRESMLMMNGFCNFYKQLSYPGDLILKTSIGAIGRTRKPRLVRLVAPVWMYSPAWR
ncbi:MAG: hypothetical protein RJB15_1110, partial [Pseudomonadota bacterium]